MAGTNDLANMVPGFEFLQGLFKSAGAGLPSFGQWVAPTLDPEELDKRIQELKTVQFWLEQNARLLGTTIQALEVQRMTLNTLQTMNLPLSDLGEALKIRNSMAAAPATEAKAPEPAAAPQPRNRSRKAKAPASEGPALGAVPAAVDPVKWWGALTQQFAELATQAVKDVAPERAAAPPVAAAPIGKTRSRPRNTGTR
jgi:hypothetical protein